MAGTHGKCQSVIENTLPVLYTLALQTLEAAFLSFSLPPSFPFSSVPCQTLHLSLASSSGPLPAYQHSSQNMCHFPLEHFEETLSLLPCSIRRPWALLATGNHEDIYSGCGGRLSKEHTVNFFHSPFQGEGI